MRLGLRQVPRDFFESIPKFGPRSALWDLQGAGAKDPEVAACGSLVACTHASQDHMLGWLNETIQEAHFEDMKHMGVEVLRVPAPWRNRSRRTCQQRVALVASSF